MADFSLHGGAPFALESGYDYTGTSGTAVTANATANTKGSWVELIAAADNIGYNQVFLDLSGPRGSARTFLIDLAVGAAASEQVIVENLFAYTSTSETTQVYCLPISIPAGQRVSIRCQASVGSAVIDAHLIVIPNTFGSDYGLSKVISFGANTADSTGVEVARTTAHTFGSWVEITSSTSEAIKGFIVSAIEASATSWTNDLRVTYEVGIGAAASEETIFSGWQIATNNLESGWNHITPFLPISIPAGTRIAIRAQCSATNADGDLDYIIHGVL